MSICPNTGHACRCQPQEGVMCPYGATPNDWKGQTTSPEKGFDPEAIMTKEEWIDVVTAKLKPYMPEGTLEYAASLYETYVEDDGEEWANDPEGAVAEDMSYWDNDE